MVQVKKIGIKQTAKVVAVFYFLISLIFVIPISLITILVGSFANQDSGLLSTAFGGLFLLLLPLFYAVIGFLMVALVSLIYNAIAKRIGGVEIDLEETNPPITS